LTPVVIACKANSTYSTLSEHQTSAEVSEQKQTNMTSWHAESQEPPETTSHGTGTHGLLDPGSSQIGHYVPPQRSVLSSPDQVSLEYPPGNTTLSVRNQVPGMSSPGPLTRVMSPTNQDNQMIVPASSIVLLGQECICPVCDCYTPDSSLCAQRCIRPSAMHRN